MSIQEFLKKNIIVQRNQILWKSPSPLFPSAQSWYKLCGLVCICWVDLFSHDVGGWGWRPVPGLCVDCRYLFTQKGAGGQPTSGIQCSMTHRHSGTICKHGVMDVPKTWWKHRHSLMIMHHSLTSLSLSECVTHSHRSGQNSSKVLPDLQY